MDDFQGTIYPPPKDGLPFLVVTFTKDGMTTQQAQTRSEARVLLSRDRARRARLETRLDSLTDAKA
jgi:hypothetical protein